MSTKLGGVGKFSEGNEKSRTILSSAYRDSIFEIPLIHALENHEYARQIVAGTMYHFRIPYQNSIHHVKIWHKLDNTYEIVGRSIE